LLDGISLIVVTNSRLKDLSRFLDSILCLDYIYPYEIIIIDQNIDDSVSKLIAHYEKSNFSIIHVASSVSSLSESRNIGISYSNYNILCFPDDDCWYDKNVLKLVTNHFTEKPEITFIIARWFENSYNYPKECTYITIEDVKNFKSIPLSSICIFCNKKNILNLSFDNRLGLGTNFPSGEDYDFFITNSEFSIALFDPNILIHHNIANRLSFFRIFSREKGTGALYVKHNVPYFVIFRGLLSPIYYCIKFFSIKYIFILFGRIFGIFLWKKSSFYNIQDRLNN